MTWEYLLIGLAIGIAIGAAAMRFGNREIRDQQVMQNELEKSKVELDEYHKELMGHFAHSAKLLDNMAKDYHRLYQHMLKSPENLLPGAPEQDSPFSYRLTGSEADNDQVPVQMPRDYFDDASSLLSGKCQACK